MSTSAIPNSRGNIASSQSGSSRQVHLNSLTNELFFAVVGPVGAGCTYIAKQLQRGLEAEGYEVQLIRISALIRMWAEKNDLPVPPKGAVVEKKLDHQKMMQDRGDEMRESLRDNAATAASAISEIRRLRAKSLNVPLDPDKSVVPDEKKRAYIIDSLKQPAEAELLSAVYRNAFTLLGVVCDPEIRKQRVLEAYFTKPRHSDPTVIEQVAKFVERDSQDPKKTDSGQQVTETFHLSDFFIDNSSDKEDATANSTVSDEIARLIQVVCHSSVIRPRLEEAAMHAASSSQRSSSCLSRQVGAALVDFKGSIVAIGTNEAPRPGGGTYARQNSYSEGISADYRCSNHRDWKGCRNTKKQRELIDEVLELFPSDIASPEARAATFNKVQKTKISQLIEYSRAVHAEMDALLSAARSGISGVGGRLFVTTFPCHYCARHIVAAGVYEVQYIEPYPKSLAIELHSDAITMNSATWIRPPGPADYETVNLAATDSADSRLNSASDNRSRKRLSEGKVLFRPFVGIAPRLYERAFTKDRGYKDKASGEFKIGIPKWGSPWALSKSPYGELEKEIAERMANR